MKVNQLKAWLPGDTRMPLNEAYRFDKETYSWTQRDQKAKKKNSE